MPGTGNLGGCGFLWQYGLLKIQERDKEVVRMCPQHDPMSYVEEWISIAQLKLAKFDPSYGHEGRRKQSRSEYAATKEKMKRSLFTNVS